MPRRTSRKLKIGLIATLLVVCALLLFAFAIPIQTYSPGPATLCTGTNLNLTPAYKTRFHLLSGDFQAYQNAKHLVDADPAAFACAGQSALELFL